MDMQTLTRGWMADENTHTNLVGIRWPLVEVISEGFVRKRLEGFVHNTGPHAVQPASVCGGGRNGMGYVVRSK